MEDLIVTNIQKVCFHDGPGIRTTVFLKGCSLKCPWCANPEASFYNNKYIVNQNCEVSDGKCAYCINCFGKNSKQEMLQNNYNKCPVAAIEQLYTNYSINDLEKIIMEDLFLYGSNGGVTFSGGEPLLQSEMLSKLMKRLKNANINIAVETCLYANPNLLKKIIEYVDLFIVDIKILSRKESIETINGDIEIFLNNIDYIYKKNKNLIFRIPLIKPYITNDKNLNLIYEFLEKYKTSKVEIFKGHNLAKEKYVKFGLQDYKVETIDDLEMNKIKKKIENLGIKVEIISF